MKELSSQITSLSADKLDRLLGRLKAKRGATKDSIPRRSDPSSAPLSLSQQGLWLVNQLEPDSAAYNVPAAFRIRGPVDSRALRKAIDGVIQRHEVLRTSFVVSDGQPKQVILERCEGCLREVDLSSLNQAQGPAIEALTAQEFRRGFDLAKGPLISAVLVRLGPEDHALLVTLHHIVSDAWSMGVLWREVEALYKAHRDGSSPDLQPLDIQYGDYAIWQRQRLDGLRLRQQLAHWRRVLEGVPLLRLPSDRLRPPVQSFRGGSQPLTLPGRLMGSLRQLARREETSLFVVILGALMTLLHRATGQDDVLLSTAVANRSRPEFEPLIGFFVNVLPLRGDLSGALSFTALIRQLRQVVLDAFSHQDTPFEKIVEELQPKRSPSHHPLVQAVMALYESPQHTALQMSGLDVRPLEQGVQFCRMDLEFLFWESRGAPPTAGSERSAAEKEAGLEGLWNYNLDLFEPATIKGMIAQFTALLESAAASPDASIDSLRLQDAAEQRAARRPPALDQLPVSPPWRPVHIAIAEAAERQAERPAVVDPNRSLTARELRAWVRTLAARLQALGAGPGHRIALSVEANSARVAAILAVLEIGATVVPLEPASPTLWLLPRLMGSGAKILIARREVFSRLSTEDAKVAWVDPMAPAARAGAPAEITPHLAREDDVAVLFYGVGLKPYAVSYRQLTDRIARLQLHHPLAHGDCVWHRASLLRDSSLWEVLWPLSAGACVAAAAAVPADKMWMAFSRLQITVAHLTAPELAALLASMPQPHSPPTAPLRLVLCSGEPVEAELLHGLRARLALDVAFLHTCPTLALELGEQLLTERDGELRPLLTHPWCDLQLLDIAGQPVPTGIRGELHAAATPHQLVPTGWLGVRHRDGTIELLATSDSRDWLDAVLVDMHEVASIVREVAGAFDCAVLARSSPREGRTLLAYLVTGTPPQSAELTSALEERLPALLRPKTLVPILRIPRTALGQIDQALLSQIPVMEQSQVPQWEAVLRANLRTEAVAAVIQPEVIAGAVVHIGDLLPGWGGRQSGKSSEPAGEEVQRFTTPGDRITPSLSEGEALRLGEDAPLTLSAALRRTVQHHPARGIFCLRSDDSQEFISYATLAERANRLAAGLVRSGVCPGDRILLQLAQADEVIVGLWGGLLAGAIVSPLAVPPSYDDETSGISKVHGAWELLGRPLVLSSFENARQLEALAARPDFAGLHVGELAVLGQAEPIEGPVERRPEDAALILLTSGSTSRPKGVVLSHRNICLRSLATIQVDGFSCDDVTLNWMPLDHVVGLVMYHIRDLLLGAQQIHGPTACVLANPLRWLTWIERFGVTVTWAPNFAYALINDRAEELAQRRFHLESVRRIENGAESIVMRTARRFLALLEPHGLRPTAMFTGWGMTETSSGVTFSRRFSLATTSDSEPFVDLGAPIPGVAIRIVDDRDRIVTEGNVGHLQVRGNTVTGGYWNASQLNQSVFTADGWFRTGDLGFISSRSLSLTGREKEVIIINAVNYHCHEIEAAVETLPEIDPTYTAAVAVRPEGSQTDQLALFFHAPLPMDDELAGLLYEIRAAVMRKVNITPDFLIPVNREDIPKTGIGKIRRAELAQRFAAGKYEPMIRRVEVLTRSANTLPDWFFSPTWQRVVRFPTPPLAAGSVLIFAHNTERSRRVVEQLRAQGLQCICVESGTGFQQAGIDRFVIDPSSLQDYLQLLAKLASDGTRVQQAVHLWNYGEHQPSPAGSAAAEAPTEYGRGASDLVQLTTALSSWGFGPALLRIVIVTSAACFVQEGDHLAADRAALSGLILTIPQEVPRLRCLMLDLDLSPRDAEHIAAELSAPCADVRVAYRGGHRLIPTLSQLDLRRDRSEDPQIVRGGFYLITGGLGGVGALVSRHLLERYDTKLLIVGRTALSEAAAASELVSQRRAVLDALQAQSRSVTYEAVDVCDRQALSAAVERAQTQFQRKLDGILHLAGCAPLRPLLEETPRAIEETLRPKVAGTLAIAALAERHPAARLIYFSSSTGFFGGAMVGVYAAACSFEQSFAAYLSARRPGSVQCISFSAWHGVGASRQFSGGEAARARGFYAMSPEQGIASFEAALRAWKPLTIVGLDSAKPAILQSLDSRGPVAVQKLAAFYVPQVTQESRHGSHPGGLADRFGSPVSCVAIPVPELPRTSQGEIDRDQLSMIRTHGGRRIRVAPRTHVEQQLATIFRQVLKVGELGVHDSFFDLGGHSMQAAQVTGRINETFQIELPLQRFFSAATIAKLGEALIEYESVPGQVVRIAEILDTVEKMSHEEAAAMLSQKAPEQVAE